MFIWNFLAFLMIQRMDVGNLVSGSSAFSKISLNIWKFTVHIFLKPGLENFEHYSASVRDECNRVVVWAFFGIAFLWDWNENWPFPVLWPLLTFPNLLVYWVQKRKSKLQGSYTSHLSEWPSFEKLQTIKAEDEGKREPSGIAGGNVTWYSHYGEQYGGSLEN